MRRRSFFAALFAVPTTIRALGSKPADVFDRIRIAKKPMSLNYQPGKATLIPWDNEIPWLGRGPIRIRGINQHGERIWEEIAFSDGEGTVTTKHQYRSLS